MGQPLGRNPTQYMMEKAFSAAGLDWRFLTLEVSPEHLVAAVEGMKAMGFRGGIFALPHQLTVLPHLDALTETAKVVGAVNLVYVSQDKYVGDNTDGKGFVEALQKLMDPKGKNIVVLGAGGTARAISVELALAGVESITIVNRTVGRGQELVTLLNQTFDGRARLVQWDGDYAVDPETDLLVNATSIGLRDESAHVPVDFEVFTEQMVVADVIHNPPKTNLLKAAGQRGCKTLDGLEMLVGHAAIDFTTWTGISPDTTIMREALEEYFEL
ncbi:MAG: shikimate dehydrogenase [Planctomycetaceae bacterium]|nr:shikimate dehydrogenase [Planctomycetaceae bacterium]MBP62243.1 shikimate dehydrogenase [Planctomycetaceae bacterium]